MAPIPKSPLSRKAWSRAADGRLQGIVVNVSGAMTRNKCRVTKTRITLPPADDSSPKGSNGDAERKLPADSTGTLNSVTSSARNRTRRNTFPTVPSPKNRKKYKTPPMTSKVRELMMSRVAARATATGDEGAGSRRRLRAKSEARSRRQKKPRVIQFPDPLEMAVSPVKSPVEVSCEVLKSEDNPEGEGSMSRGMSLRSGKSKSPGTSLKKERSTRCRRRLWKPEPPARQEAANADAEVENPKVESDDGKPTSTSEVIDVENDDDLKLELSVDDKTAHPDKPKEGQEEEPIETHEALVPLQVWKVGSSRLSFHGMTDDTTENQTIARYYTQQMGTPEEQGAGDGDHGEEEDSEDLDFVPDIPLDLSKSEEAPPLSPEALALRAERASPIRGPEDILRECFVTHSLRIRPKRMFKTYPVAMEFTHVIGSGGFAVCDLAVLGSTVVRMLDGMRVVVKRTPKAKCPDGAPQREVEILRLFDQESAENYFLRFFFSMERHDEILMVTEYIEGGNLASFYVHNLENIQPELTRYFLAQLAVSIGVLHQRFNVIHRDIKPENVCLTRDGIVKILDFGLAVKGPTCDLKGGTPRYQNKAMRLGETHSYEADWYSFGASAFLLFSGCIPPPEHPRDYEMDRTDIAPEDQRFILALVFGTLRTIDEVLRNEWFNQVDMLAVLQTRPPPMASSGLFPFVKEARPKNQVQRIEVDLDDLEDGLRQEFPGFTQLGNF